MNDTNFKYIGVVQNTEQLKRLEVSCLTEMGLVPFVWVEDVGKFLYFINDIWTLDKDMSEWDEIYKSDGIIINEKDGEQKVSFLKDFDEIEMERDDFVDLISALLKINKVPVGYIIDKMDDETTVQDLCEIDGGVLKLLLPEEDIERVMETYKYWMGLFVENEEEGGELLVINETNNVEDVVPFYDNEEQDDIVSEDVDCEDITIEPEDVVENLDLEDIVENFVDFGDIFIEEDEIVSEDDANVDLSEMLEAVQETADKISTEEIIKTIEQEMEDPMDNDVRDIDEEEYDDWNEIDDWSSIEEEFDDWNEIDDKSSIEEEYDEGIEDNQFECDDDYEDDLEDLPEMRQVHDVFGNQPMLAIQRPGAIMPSRFVKQDGESVNELVMDDNLAEKIPTFNENDLLVVLKVRIQEIMNITNADGDKPFENDECLQNVINKLVEAQMWLNLWSRIN